jgi:type IV secretory pathway VirD2 relaxase
LGDKAPHSLQVQKSRWGLYMSGDDNPFTPKLGRIRSGNAGTKRGMRSFLKTARSFRSARKSSGSSQRSNGGTRRVVIKARFVTLAGKGMALQRAHLSYLQRDGAGRGEERGEFYDNEREGIDGQDWLEEAREDKHHFRFIVSPEDGHRLDDLKPFIRDLAQQMEIDLETRLDWIAVDHHNTEHPHTHIVMSGRRDDGTELRIPRDYLSHGMRERGSAILTRDLGLQTAEELEAKLDAQISERRVTSMDRVLAGQAREHGDVDLARVTRHKHHYQKRLTALRTAGLAAHVGGTRWQVSDDLIQSLDGLERRDQVARRIEEAVRDKGLERASAMPDEEERSPRKITGRLLTIARADEMSDRAYAIIDGMDGRAHHVELGSRYTQGLKAGDIVSAKARADGALKMDRVIEAVSKDHYGNYSTELHRKFDPDVSKNDLQMIGRRLRALSEQMLVAHAEGDRFGGCADLVHRIDEHAARVAKRSPTIMRKRDDMDFAHQVKARGLTWLDRHLAGEVPEQVGHTGLGGEVRTLAKARRQLLVERGITSPESTKALEPEALERLRHADMHAYGKQIAGELGRAYHPIEPGMKVEGKLSRIVDTGKVKYGVLEHARKFSLVPWSREMDRMRDRQMQITLSRSMSLSWTRGRGRERGLGISR